ncbi:MAG: endonuclease III [Alphaproteobacteria bacterium]|nr:endonuclease III [Alphaproteobacteria bacterium]
MATHLSKKQIENLFQQLQTYHPIAKTELNFTNHYTLLTAVILSAQATDASVNKATGLLFALAETPEKMLALGEQKLCDYIKSIGLYRNKAKHIIKTARILMEQHKSKIPKTREALEKLPGVGRKTANVILNVAFNEPTIPVDTHVFRVSNRTGLSDEKNVREVERDLERHIPPIAKSQAHHLLVLHGRYICKARKPLCNRCPIDSLCLFSEKIF